MTDPGSRDVSTTTRTEGMKLEFEVFKHLTTLGTAVLLAAAAFVDKVFDDPRAQWLLVIACVCFLVSIWGSIGSMFAISRGLRSGSVDEQWIHSAQLFGAAGFVSGLFTIFVFFSINVI